MLVEHAITTRKDGTVEKSVLNAMSVGIAAQDFYDYSIDLGNITGEKYANGDTIPNSQGIARKEYIDSLRLDKTQTKMMYEMFEVSKKIQNGEVTQTDLQEALSLGATRPTYEAYKAQDFSGKGGDQRRMEWIFDNATSETELVALYQMAFENKNTKEEDTIAYAMQSGVSPENFVKRIIQKASEEGDKTVGTEITLVNGKAVTTAVSETVDGTKKRDSMTNLLESGYTDEEKLYFYQKENPSDDKFVWAMVGGIPVDEYLKLQRDSWDIHGEKDKNGKTITGSKKAAFAAYLDTLDLNDAQKGMLMIQNGYTVDSSVKSAVVEYINNLGLTSTDRDALMNALKLTSSGGSGGGKKKKSFKYSAAAKPPSSSGSIKVVKSAPVRISDSSDNLRRILDSIRNITRGNAANAALQEELRQIDENIFLTAAQKAARKRDIQRRYNQ